ncbi:MAG: universal stress protein [Nitrospiraceae bacterium]
MAPALLITRNESDCGGDMAESLFKKILVPIDFSPCSEEAFRVALILAKTYQAELLLLPFPCPNGVSAAWLRQSCEKRSVLSLQYVA